jgi:hypothetical protein
LHKILGKTPNKILKIIAIFGNPIKFKHLNRELAWKCPSLIYFVLKEFDGLHIAKNFGKSSAKKHKGKYFEKISWKKSQNPLNLGKKSQNPEENCRDFLIPKIFVRFFQSNLPLDLRYFIYGSTLLALEFCRRYKPLNFIMNN